MKNGGIYGYFCCLYTHQKYSRLDDRSQFREKMKRRKLGVQGPEPRGEKKKAERK